MSHPHPAQPLRHLLTSLLLFSPTRLDRTQISPDLLMRHRMLSLPPNTPPAYDSPESDTFSTTSHLSISDEERIASQHAFVEWLSRPPVELNLSAIDVAATANSFFARRLTAIRVAQRAVEDPIDVDSYEVMCCDTWHGDRRMLVKFPPHMDGEDLYMMVVVGDEGEMQLDNLFATQQVVVQEGGLHRWTEACTARRETGDREEGADQGAEYINDADDFWAGFSHDDDDGGRAEGEVRGECAGEANVADGREAATEQEAAIKDIIRGAYTLHRSIRPSSGDEVEDFMRLVRSAIGTA